MKKLLFLFVFVLTGIAANAQWPIQSTGFPLPSVGINNIQAVDQNILWATGYDGSGGAVDLQVFTRTNDGGATWTAGEILDYPSYGVAMIFGVNYTTAWVPLYEATSGGGVLLKTTDGGATWTPQTTAAFTAPNGFPNVVHFWSETEGFCFGDPNGGYMEIYTTTDGGDNWVRVPQANIPANLSSEYGLTNCYSVVDNTIWFGTTKGRVYKSIDKGLNWTVSTVTSSWSNIFVDVDFISATHGIAHHRGNGTATLPADGSKYETFDGGTTWSLVTQTGPLYTNDFAFVPGLPNTMVATGSESGNSGVAYSPDGGHTWTDFDTTAGYQFLATEWVDNLHGWAGGFTDANDFSGGMFKYGGDVLTDILNIDPKQGGVKIYPNPSNGHFTCAIIGFESKNVNITIYNAVGQEVYNNTVNQSLISYNHYIDLSNLESGLYIACIQSGNKVMTEKLSIR